MGELAELTKRQQEQYGRRVEIDFETRSYADLKKVGAWVYSEHPSTEVICLCYGIDSGEIKTWIPRKVADEAGWGHEFCTEGDRIPTDLYMAIMVGAEVEAHNISFEVSIWFNVMAKRYGWVKPNLHQWRDSMAAACYYAMPAGLDPLARALGFPGKDPEGSRLISKYSKLHLKTAKPVIPAEDLKKFVAYCVKDVMLEQSVSDYLGDLPERELPHFLDALEINLEGLYLDLEGIEQAAKIVDARAEKLTAEFLEITGGIKPTQIKALLPWFEENGLKLENMRAGYLEELIEDGEVPQGPARKALEIRLQINKASTKKLDKMAMQRSSDGTAKFQTRYHGAQTGRTTGEGFQPLNLARGWEDIEPEMLVKDIMRGDAEWLDCCYGDAMQAVANASRHWIMAQPGRRIMAGDFVSIEAVVLACLAEEKWKIEAFEKKHPLYALMACKIHNIPESVALELGDKGFKKKYGNERQDGKTGELAFGYQGALGAWLKFDNSGRHTDERIIEICKAWRAEHPAVTGFWRGLQEAAIEAVEFPGRETGYNTIGFEVVDDWLSMILPNGKRIWYFKPELRMKMPAWHKPEQEEDCAAGTCRCEMMPTLSYMAQKTGQWKRVYTYGGKLTENACQATSREITMAARRRLKKLNYPITLDVYDEIKGTPKIGFGDAKEFQEVLEYREDWCKDWPIRAEVWEGDRYKK